jgi:hypothetical protein
MLPILHDADHAAAAILGGAEFGDKLASFWTFGRPGKVLEIEASKRIVRTRLEAIIPRAQNQTTTGGVWRL